MTKNYENEIREVIEVMIDAARKDVLPRFGRVVEEIKNKTRSGYFDSVTVADRDASTRILEQVRKKFPGSYSEEHPFLDDERRWNSEFVWHFDPVDGTREFCEGIEDGYAMNGALLRRQADGHYLPVAGIIYMPGTDKLAVNFGDGKNHLFQDGREVTPSLSNRKKILGWIRKVDPSSKLIDFHHNLGNRLNLPVEIVHRGGIGASIVDILEGRINLIAFNYNNTREWDWAMAVPMIESAGGFICDGEGMHRDNYNRKTTQDKKEYDLRGVVASTAFKKEEVIPYIPQFFIEDRF